MASNPFGTVFVEFDMDSTRYMRGQRTLLAEAQNASKTLEKNFHNLGIKSDATFDMMRSRASLAYQAIVNDARSSFGDRLRAQQAYSIAAQRIDMEQFNQEKNLHEQRKQMSRDSQAGWVSMMKGMLAYRVILSGIMGVQEAFAGTFRYLATIETAQLGIGAAFMTSGQYIDATTGKALKGAEALKAAQVESKQVIEELKAANLQTIATLDQLIVAYQQTLPVAMAKGFDKRMVKEFTVAMVQAAGAIGLPMDQLGEETRSMLTGSINPRTSRIATVLGLRNEDIAEYKNNAEGLFNFLMDKLKAYQVAGVEAQTTWAGLWSNMKDLAFQYLGEGMTPLFEGIKASLVEITNSMVRVNETTKQIEWNPEFLESMKTIKSGMTTFIADLRRISMLIDLVGIGMAKVGQLATLGLSKTMDNAVDTYTARLKAGEKALMDMAMREEGYKPATKDTPGAISQEGYYAQALWYVKETAKETKYLANETKKVSEEAKRLSDQWKEQERTLNAQIAGEGLGKYERKVIDIRREAEKLTEQFKAVPGATAKIAEWKGSQERGVIIEQEEEIAKAVEKIREDVMKKEMDAQAFMRKEDERLRVEQEKGMKEYERIVTESNDWSISEHQRAINKILSDESKHIIRMYELWEAGSVTIEQLTAGIAAIRGASDAATDAQTQKKLAAEINFYEQITGYEDEYRKKQLEWIDKEAKRRAEAYKDDVAAAKWAAQEKGRLEQSLFEKKTAEVHKGLADMANAFSAIGSMYDKNSAEYARMQEAAKAMIVLQQAVAVANAVAAIANQGLGDPYSAFARIAAMAAAMGSLLASAGLSFGGGGAATAPILPASTVLGAEAGTGSESISKGWELLQDTYDMEYRELSGIHNSMKELNRNITGLVTSIVRTGSAGGFTSAPPGTEGIAGSWGSRNVDFLNMMTFGPSISKDITSFIMSPLLEKIMGWLGTFANNVMSHIIGGGTSSSITSGGIQFGGASVGGLLAGGGMGGKQYADIATQHEGGWFHEDWMSVETQYDALNQTASDMLDTVFQDLGRTLVKLAEGLGTDTQVAMDYVFESARIDLLGKSAEDISKAISEFISSSADTAAETLFGDLLLGYQRLNEGTYETAIRIVTDMTIVTEALDMTGQAFTGTIPQIIAFSEHLIDLAGDLEHLMDISATYYDAFFTDEEKQARLQAQLSAAIGDLGYTLPTARDGYRAIVESLDLTTESGQKAYVMLLEWSEAADEYYSAVEDAVGSTDKLIESLKKQSAAIQAWLHDINLSALAPVTSQEAWSAEYERQKAMASASGATEQDVTGFLNYAKEYLQFMRTFGGDYQAIFDAVVGDVAQLGEIKDAQIAAIQAADEAARINADRIVAAITTGRDIGGPAPPIRAYASGGLTSGPSLAGESGREWIVPTYEPQRSQFLKSVPPEFWENLRGGGAASGGGDTTIRLVNVLDSKVLSDSVAVQIPRNAKLSEAIRRVN